MIVWYPILKVLVMALLFALSFYPLVKHFKDYERRREEGPVDGADEKRTPLPIRLRSYLPMIIVLLLFFLTPFRLQSPQQLERQVQTYDRALAPPPMIQRNARTPYQPDDHQSLIREIMKKETAQ